MAETYTPMTFSVRALDVSVNAILATVAGLPDVSFNADVTALLNLTVAQAKEMFHFQSDAIDVNNVVAEDLKYKLIYTPATLDNGVPDASWMFDNFIYNTICDGTDNDDHTYTVATSGASNKAVTHDYVRYLAYKLFNTHLGVDLFNNEEEVRNGLNDSARTAFDTVLQNIHDHESNDWLDASAATSESAGGFKAVFGDNHPTYNIIQALINSHPERFYDLSNNFISGSQSGQTDPAQQAEFSVPFVTGDVIQFQLTIKANSGQTDILSSLASPPTIGDRTYRIRIELQ